MLDYTKMAIRQTVSDLKKADYIRNVVTQIVYIVYLIYALIARAGFLAANIPLLILSCAYFVFFLFMTARGAPEEKAVKRTVKNIYIWCKRLIKLFTLGVTLYGLYATVEQVTPLSVVLTAMMIVGWTLQIVFEVLLKIVTSRINLILEGLEADLDSLTKPVRTVGNFFKKIAGKEVAPEKVPTKNQLKLKEKVEAYRAEKKRLKEEARSAAKARRSGSSTLRDLSQDLSAAGEAQSLLTSETSAGALSEPTAEETALTQVSEPAASKSSFFSRFRKKK